MRCSSLATNRLEPSGTGDVGPALGDSNETEPLPLEPDALDGEIPFSHAGPAKPVPGLGQDVDQDRLCLDGGRPPSCAWERG